MIAVENLVKKFGNLTVLADVNFSVAQGEIVGLLGPNGAGKTTTMKIITGFWRPTSGRILIAGLNPIRQETAAKRKIGYLPENVPVYDDLKVFEYLKLVAELRDITGPDILPRLKEVAGLVGLQKVMGRSLDQLSKGYRQRVALAQAIIHDPEILILDEPTTGLDPNQIVDIRNLIKEIGQEKTVLFSTHILAEAAALCDRLLIINQGRIVAAGTPAELSAQAQSGWFLALRAPAEITQAVLTVVSGVAKVEVLGEADGVTNLSIQVKPDQDARLAVAVAVAEQGWPVLEFKSEEGGLEAIFQKLTKSQ